MPTFTTLKPPTSGTAITRANGRLIVPDDPIIPFIEGDGTGPDIWRASVRVFDAAVAKAYGGRRRIAWMEVYAGEKSFTQFDTWLPDDTIEAFREYYVGIKGPLTTPVGGGIRSLNVALRQLLDLYVCLRPVRWYTRRPVAGAASRESGHRHLPREHGRHLRRDRVRGGHRRRRRRCSTSSQKEFPKDFKKIRFGTLEAAAEWQQRLEGDRRAATAGRRRGRHRPQADQLSRIRAADPQRDQLRDRRTSARASPSCTRATS